MVFKTTQDVIDRIKEFHAKMNDYYNQIDKSTDDPRLKMLLDYLRQREKNFEECLDQFEQDTSEKILNTWFKYIPDSDAFKGCKDLEVKPNMTIDQVTEIAYRAHHCFSKFYQMMAENCVIPEIKELFTNLLNKEKRQGLDLAIDVMSLKFM
jgi:rubrerythrin